jgi:hypothetical protein
MRYPSIRKILYLLRLQAVVSRSVQFAFGFRPWNFFVFYGDCQIKPPQIHSSYFQFIFQFAHQNIASGLKVAATIPDEVKDFFYLPHPSSGTTALGFNQPQEK